MPDLTKLKCKPHQKDWRPLKRSEFKEYLAQIPNWKVIKGDKAIERDFEFKNFKEALAFVNEVGEFAESEGHHPDVFMHNWRMVRLTLTTHAVGGLSLNDFIMASKIKMAPILNST